MYIIFRAIYRMGSPMGISVIREEERPKDCELGTLHHGEGGEDEEPTTETEN